MGAGQQWKETAVSLVTQGRVGLAGELGCSYWQHFHRGTPLAFVNKA